MIKKLLTLPCPPIRHRPQAFLLVESFIIAILSFSILDNEADSFSADNWEKLAVDISLSVMVSFVVIMRMPVWLNPERWVVWKFLVCTAAELLLMTVCLFASEMVFVQMYGSTLHIAFNPESSLTRNFISMLLMNGIIGIMLGTVVYYYISTADLKRMLMEEESLKKRLMERLRDKMPSLLCNRHIELGNGKDALSLLPEELYYIEAAGNYVEIHYADAAGVMRKHLLRDTISHIETELKDYPDIVRCHRAFIANLRQVEKVTNNRQNIFLKMNSGNALVPVSRSYRKDLKLK